VDAASRTKVDQTRELLDNVPFAPVRGRFKVYLIDEVHMFSASSFNALLKTLEEPPPHVKFVLATTDPQKLPATVLSRCLQFNLKRLLPEQIAAAFGTCWRRNRSSSRTRPWRCWRAPPTAACATGSACSTRPLPSVAVGSRADDVQGHAGHPQRRPDALDLLDAMADGDGARGCSPRSGASRS
jgi:DNA polymerase-3 subunit gamma/tau